MKKLFYILIVLLLSQVLFADFYEDFEKITNFNNSSVFISPWYEVNDVGDGDLTEYFYDMSNWGIEYNIPNSKDVAYYTYGGHIFQIELDLNDTFYVPYYVFLNYKLNYPKPRNEIVKLKECILDLPEEILDYYNFTWYSANPDIASVDENGFVTIEGYGKTDVYICSEKKFNLQDSTNSITRTFNNKKYYAYEFRINVERPVYDVTGVELDHSDILIEKNSSYRLKATISPDNATNTKVTWSSSNESIATVNDNGVVTGVGIGITTITVKTDDGGFTAECRVTVRDGSVKGVTLNESEITVGVNGKYSGLEATLIPDYAVIKKVTWSSSNEEIATVDKNGVVTGVSEGEAYITVKTADGGYEDQCKVTVINYRVTGVTLNKSGITMDPGTTYDGLKATVSPENASNKDVTWSSSDTDVATVNQNGVVTAVSSGTAYITVKTVDGGFTAKCKVNVINYFVTGVKLNKSSITIDKGTVYTDLVATVSPSTAKNKEVTWSSNKTSVATVDQNGVVTGVDGGNAVITVKTKDGGFIAKCNVKVVVHVSSIKLNKSSITIETGTTYSDLKATILPDNATDKEVIWSSNKTSVATVDQNGVITGISNGVAIVTVKTKDGELTDTCEVNVVTPEPSSITVSKSSLTVGVGQTATISATVLPENANQTIVWISKDKTIATVSNGKIKGVKEGTVYVNAYTYNKKLYAKCKVTVVANPESITLNKTSETVCVGQKFTLKATVLPADAPQTVIWSSKDTSIATVSNGTVKGVGVGSTYIVAHTFDKKLYAKCKVTVIPYPESITLDKSKETVCVGQKFTLKATVLPANAPQTVVWVTKDKSIATVSNGQVKGVGVGSTTIIAYTYDKKLYAKCQVTVIPYPESITLDKTTASVVVGKKITLTAKVLPANAPQTVIWVSKDKSIATVSNGQVKGVSPGTVYINAYTYDKKLYAKCKVTVIPAPEEVVLSKTSMTIYVGNTATLTASVLPEGANQGVTFESSDTSVATVNSSGVIKGVKVGTAYITVRTKDKSKYKKCKVAVKNKPVTGVSLNKTSLELELGSSVILKATVKPSDATNKGVVWSSSDTGVVIVASTGKLTTVKTGVAYVTVTTKEGGYTAKCKVTVKNKAVTGVSLDKTSLELEVGKTATLTATVKPADATVKFVSWTSSNTKIATVNAGGKVTGVAPGTTNIIVTTQDGGYIAMCKVKVN